MDNIILGICSICDRDMWEGTSCNKHHFTPKSRGGRETVTIHRVCHSKIHSILTEKQLERNYNTPDKLRAHPEMKKFIVWLKKKEPDFYSRATKHKDKK
jgi:hypothetical protein